MMSKHNMQKTVFINLSDSRFVKNLWCGSKIEDNVVITA